MKKHLALLFFIVTVLVLAVMIFKINTWKDQGTFYLKDILGKRSALEEISISGELQDGYHRTHFEITDESLDKKTEIFSIPHYSQSNRLILGEYINGFEINVHGSFNQYEIRSINRRDPNSNKSGTVKVRTAVHAPFPKNSAAYTNRMDYSLTHIKDKIYFTVPSTKDYTGTNGIYELDFSKEVTRKVTTYSLDQNKDDDSPNLSVLGLESVGDKLALILAEGDYLIIRGYDIHGEPLGEAVIEDFILPGYDEDASSEYPNADVHFERYLSFSDPDQMVLNMIFHSEKSTKTEKHKTMISVDFSSGVELIDTVKDSYMDVDQDGVTQMRYINGKMYLVKTQAEKHEQIGFSIYLKQLYIYVYESGNRIYKGEIITDRNDDLIRVINQQGGYMYDRTEHRQFSNIKIKSSSRK